LFFHIKSPSLLLLKQPACLFFSFSHLLIQYLVLCVLQIPQILSLFINNSLPSHLFFLKLLLFLILPQLLKTLLLFRIFLYFLLLNQYPLFFFLLLN
jgi:hypothetical protein